MSIGSLGPPPDWSPVGLVGTARTRKTIIEREIKDMLQKSSHSPYASSIVLVKKKTGDIRFCLDFCQLNHYAVRDAYPLPRIADLLDAVKGSRYFVALDMRSGYWQIKMRNEDILKTAFLSHRGLYEFTVMPFGLVNAPATFQRMVDRLFGDLCLGATEKRNVTGFSGTQKRSILAVCDDWIMLPFIGSTCSFCTYFSLKREVKGSKLLEVYK